MSGALVGIATIVAMVTFLAIVWWAWSSHRARDNEQASRLPFDLPDEIRDDQNSGEKS